MTYAIIDDLAKKAQAMLEFRRYRDAGLPVPAEVRARHVAATNDGYATGPDPGEQIPEFSLADQHGAIRTLGDLAGPSGLFLVFHRSAEWCQYCRSQLVELEQSRMLLERNGVHVAAISYDSQPTLASFSQQYSIGYPLLSDRASGTIRSFGIFNHNMAPELKAYGVPHPVEYLVSPNGTVLRKYFVPNYMHRVTSSSVALREFSTVAEGAPSVTLKQGMLTATIGFASDRAFAGQEVGFCAKFVIESGWHIYGSPLPSGYTATAVSFDDARILRQSFHMPEETKLELSMLGERLPVYGGTAEGLGSLLLEHPIPEGEIVLKARLDVQQCSDTVCEPPLSLPFDLPLRIEPFLVNERDRKLLDRQQAGQTALRG